MSAKMDAYDDIQLIKLVRSGDRLAFDELYNRHWQLTYTRAFNLLRDREDSLDVCQSVFLWLWENRQAVHIRSTLEGYLYTAVKYKIANLIRHGKVRESFFEEIKHTDTSAFESHDLEVKELKSLIHQLIDELPPKCREVFRLSRQDHLSHKEIAERLAISEKTVDDHITRALKKLRGPLNRLASIFLTL